MTAYEVLFHPSRDWWELLDLRDRMPYSAYPVVSRTGLTLAEARAFTATQGVPSEWYTIRPITGSA